MKWKFINLIIIVFILISCSPSNSKIESISVVDLMLKLKEDESISIIDVRTFTEFNGPLGHIPSAQLKPLSDINNTINELKHLVDKPIYVICRSGNRSLKVSSILQKNGLNAINVDGGMKAWKRVNE